jgi:hypothetical protein
VIIVSLFITMLIDLRREDHFESLWPTIGLITSKLALE